MKHDPPQVLTVAAITCRQCGGSQSFDDNGEVSHCHICENGYEKVMVPVIRLGLLIQKAVGPDELYNGVVALAEAAAVRLPVLTHNTALLPVHLLPQKRRFPLGITPPQTIHDKNAK